MCYHCHTLKKNLGAPAHRSSRCIDPTNGRGRRHDPAAADAAAAAAAPSDDEPSEGGPTACRHCKSTRHTDDEHQCAVCSGHGHRGRNCPTNRSDSASCSLCGSDSHRDVSHKCPVCLGTGHRGRDCAKFATEGLPGRKVKLYHRTDEGAARSITASQKFKPGTKGMMGAGIYFAQSHADCVGKAQSTGAYLSATVELGRSRVLKTRKEATENWQSLNPAAAADKLKRCNCGSVKAGWTRAEYAVFEDWRVAKIKVDTFERVDGSGVVTTVPVAQWPDWIVELDQFCKSYNPPAAPARPQRTTPRVDTRPTDRHGTPIAKSTGKPDRRYKQPQGTPTPAPPASRPIDRFSGVPIAKSTGRPDRRYTNSAVPFPGYGSSYGGGGGGGFGGGGGGDRAKNGHDYSRGDSGPLPMDEQEIHRKLADRLQCKLSRDFDRADAIRDELKSQGIEIYDKEKMWKSTGGGGGGYGGGGGGGGYGGAPAASRDRSRSPARRRSRSRSRSPRRRSRSRSPRRRSRSRSR